MSARPEHSPPRLKTILTPTTTHNQNGPMSAMTSSPVPVKGSLILAVWSLLAREWIRFLRQRNRMIGALATPILFWAFFGSGFGSSFRPGGLEGGMSYSTYFFPGTLVLVVLFTAIFSSISVIEDRNAGFLQGVMVSPVSRLSIVLGKVLGSATLGLFQGVLIMALAPFVGFDLDIWAVVQAVLVMFMIAFSLSGLGFLLAWRMDSVQGFHAVMNLLLMPLWFLSGALFPASGASGWIQVLMSLNPLTYGLSALRLAMHGQGVVNGGMSMEASLGILALMTVGVLIAAVWVVNRPVTHN
ncbi:MAG: ABC transporter permease [Deltaproteobacteria bacterium]|nr:ABC transporter permease [Deltaproteobacteria bacterium]